MILAKSGKQAIDKANSKVPPDLILLDVMMSEMDGYTTCRSLKKSPITRDIPVIFVTAKQDSDDERIGLEGGYSGKTYTKNRQGTLQSKRPGP